MPNSVPLALTLAAAAQAESPLLPGGTEGLFLGMIAMTTLAGWLDVAQQMRGGATFPVPLVVYLTMLPVITFIVVLSHVKGEGVHLGLYAATLSPLPFVVLPRLAKLRRGAEDAVDSQP